MEGRPQLLFLPGAGQWHPCPFATCIRCRGGLGPTLTSRAAPGSGLRELEKKKKRKGKKKERELDPPQSLASRTPCAFCARTALTRSFLCLGVSTAQKFRVTLWGWGGGGHPPVKVGTGGERSPASMAGGQPWEALCGFSAGPDEVKVTALETE